MNIEHVKCFFEVAKVKSISKASQNLNITQPALSKKIKYLEDYLGVTLFIRNSKGVSLTKEGIFFFKHAKKLLGQLEAIKSEIKNISAVKHISYFVTRISRERNHLPARNRYTT